MSILVYQRILAKSRVRSEVRDRVTAQAEVLPLCLAACGRCVGAGSMHCLGGFDEARGMKTDRPGERGAPPGHKEGDDATLAHRSASKGVKQRQTERRGAFRLQLLVYGSFAHIV